jgi:hypothetical protein
LHGKTPSAQVRSNKIDKKTTHAHSLKIKNYIWSL